MPCLKPRNSRNPPCIDRSHVALLKVISDNLLKKMHKAEPQRQGHITFDHVLTYFHHPLVLKASGICIPGHPPPPGTSEYRVGTKLELELWLHPLLDILCFDSYLIRLRFICKK